MIIILVLAIVAIVCYHVKVVRDMTFEKRASHRAGWEGGMLFVLEMNPADFETVRKALRYRKV